mmetsp:Transcript_5655/g.12853  ORF Transcript_5655/g.12853 Transcript_5655/m.12853 type:complete len:635 (+) Transcript_5655:32-1936(+)
MTMESAPSVRTIDDFLEQLYQEYKRRLPRNTCADIGTGAPSSSHSVICQYQHYLPLPLLALCIANSSDATEILMLSYLLANSEFRDDMFSGKSMAGAEYLAASIFLGMLLGGTLFGFLSDHIGRRPALLAGLLINATAGLFSSFSFLTPTIAQLTTWRFFAGIGIGATVPSIFSLASEWSPKEVRGAVVTVVASFWMVGSLFVSGLAWLLFSGQDHSSLPTWRIFAALCAMPSALGAWMVYKYVPESPRFLATTKQNYDQTAHVCNHMAKSLKLMNDAICGAPAGHIDGNQSIEKDEHDETREPNTADRTDSMHHSVSMHFIQPLTEEELRQHYASVISTHIDTTPSTLTDILLRTYHTLLQTLQRLYSPQLFTRTTLPLQAIWFSLSFSTYGITTWINTLFVEIHLQNIYFNSFLFALANLPGNFISLMYSDRFGRKRMLVGSLIGAAGGLAAFAILAYWGDAGDDNDKDGPSSQSTSNARMYGIVLSACIFQMFSIVSWNTIDILTGELFPTRVRSAGMGACTACGRFGAMFAQLVNARLMMAGGGEGSVASASVLVVAASTLLMAAGMPMFLERDMALGELKDEITEEATNSKSVTLGCIAKIKGQKDHLSDDEMEDLGLRNRLNEEAFLL